MASASLGGEERKLSTVLFADLVGSTAQASGEDPERVRRRLERFYDATAAEIEAAGGTVEKFAGDAVMAVFGAPAALEDHAERALHAALALRRRVRELFGEEAALRIGVNTGEVVVGLPREGSSFVSGDAVNVAARLEQAAEPGEVLVGERTVSAVRGAFELSSPRTVEAKGKPGGVPCRALQRALTLQRPRGVGALLPAFVGRENELERLQAAYRAAVADGAPKAVAIVGDAGLGKTRLVRELWQWLAAQEPQPLQRTGRCLPYGQSAYWAMGEMLKEQLGILEGESPESVRAKLGGREILGLALGLDVAFDLHPLVARDRFQDAWVELLEELTSLRPAALLVEDLHWAEEPLFDLLEHVLGRVRGPLLLLGTARPELLDSRPGFGRTGELLPLEPLETSATAELLTRLLGGEPPSGLRELVAHTEGNPFFLEEALAALIDRRVLLHENGAWALSDPPAEIGVPDTVHALVASRIDLLDAPEKEALQAAAVIGRIFWSGPVYELCPGAEPDLRVLEERDFVRPRLGSSIEGEREYAIKHTVTREVAYAGIPKARRARLHAAFAAWVDRFGEGRDELAPILAHHLAEAVRPEDADLAWAGEEVELERVRERAVRWLRRSAELAVGRYEIDEALSYLHRAVELEPSDAERATLWRRIGRANALKFDGEAFWRAMELSLELAEHETEAAEIYGELAYQTAGRSGMWKKAPAAALVHGWIERALDLGGPASPARAKALIASVFWDLSHPERAAEASELAERLGDRELMVNAWVARGLAATARLDYREALEWLQRPLEVVEQIEDPELVSEIYWHPLPCEIALGRFSEARRLAERYSEASRRLTAHHRVHGISSLCEVAELTCSWATLVELQEQVEAAVADNAATPCVRNPRSLLVCALAHWCLGNEREAARLEAKAQSIWMEGYPVVLGPLRIRLALVRGELGALEGLLGEGITRHSYWFGLAEKSARMDALVALRNGRRIEEEALPLLSAGPYLEPFALRALGIVREDAELVEEAQERFRAMGLDWHAAQTELLSRGV